MQERSQAILQRQSQLRKARVGLEYYHVISRNNCNGSGSPLEKSNPPDEITALFSSDTNIHGDLDYFDLL